MAACSGVRRKGVHRPEPAILLRLVRFNRSYMPDDSTKKRPQDGTRINIHEPWELTYGSQKFGVTLERLKAAVATVGPMVKDVEKHLGRQ
jgi:hypothetical protein